MFVFSVIIPIFISPENIILNQIILDLINILAYLFINVLILQLKLWECYKRMLECML